MKIKLGIRGTEDAVSAIIIKLDDLMLVTADNLFLSGTEGRENTGKGIISLLDSLSVDHDIEIGETIIPMLEDELYIEKGTLNKFLCCHEIFFPHSRFTSFEPFYTNWESPILFFQPTWPLPENVFCYSLFVS